MLIQGGLVDKRSFCVTKFECFLHGQVNRPKVQQDINAECISIYINVIMTNCSTESSKIFQYKWILSWLVPQGLTKPRQMLVVKDTCMAAIEYFTEPGDHLSILIILIDIVNCHWIPHRTRRSVTCYCPNKPPPLPINIVVVIATVDTKKTPRHHRQITKKTQIWKNGATTFINASMRVEVDVQSKSS